MKLREVKEIKLNQCQTLMKYKKLISDGEKLIEKLRKEGKVTEVNLDFLNSKEFEDFLKRIHEDSNRKLAQSWIDAKDVILD